MSKVLVTKELLDDLANAIAGKTGEITPLTIEDMTDAVDGITNRSSSDLTASGATVTVPAGLYHAQATKSVASGTAGTPTATKGAVSNHTVSVTPSVTNTAGYISGGTISGSPVSVSASELVSGTLNVTSSGTKDVTNYASASIPAGSATASATKGTVSNHSVSVTPSVTKSAGWISAGSSTGTAVTVSASELDSGTKSITQNGTGIDVVGYAAVDVAVSGGIDMPTFTLTLSGGQIVVTCDKTYQEAEDLFHDGIATAVVVEPDGALVGASIYNYDYDLVYAIVNEGVPDADIHYSPNGTLTFVYPSAAAPTFTTKNITVNGTYNASSDSADGYSSVTVNVPSSQPTLQTKSKTYTPTTSQQTESVTADNGYDGLSAVNVTVNAMPTMTLPSAASASSTGTEQAVIRPSANNQYINIPTGYNGAAKFYEIAPTMLGTKSITENGTYVAMDDDLHGFSSVTVNVSGGSSEVAVNSSTGYSSGGSDIIFYDLLGEPTSFVIFCVDPTTLTTGASPYKTAAVVYDGVNDKVQYITNTNNAQMTYEGPGAYHFYSNGQLVVTCSDSQFVSGQYGMYYTYGGGAGNIGTSLVQVGSGATSIQFTNLPDEPIYWSCMFTGNIGTSSGYTRAHVVASADGYIVGREMGSASTFSNEHWTATYNNGTLTITSQSTSAGGYFHQPGYYQLTYGIGGDNTLQTKTVTPTTATQNVTADTAQGYTALKKVIVNPIPSSYVEPTTTIGATTYRASTSSQTISAGTYHSAAATIAAVTQTNLDAGNIKSGTTITISNGQSNLWSVTGTYTGGGTSSKNVQISQTPGRAASSTYTAVGPSLTVSKTGKYSVYWVGYRSSTSGTSGSQLYIGDTAYGSAQTTFDSGSGLTNLQHVKLTGVSLTQNQVLTIRARSRGNSYYMYIQDLVIIEE